MRLRKDDGTDGTSETVYVHYLRRKKRDRSRLIYQRRTRVNPPEVNQSVRGGVVVRWSIIRCSFRPESSLRRCVCSYLTVSCVSLPVWVNKTTKYLRGRSQRVPEGIIECTFEVDLYPLHGNICSHRSIDSTGEP